MPRMIKNNVHIYDISWPSLISLLTALGPDSSLKFKISMEWPQSVFPAPSCSLSSFSFTHTLAIYSKGQALCTSVYISDDSPAPSPSSSGCHHLHLLEPFLSVSRPYSSTSSTKRFSWLYKHPSLSTLVVASQLRHGLGKLHWLAQISTLH